MSAALLGAVLLWGCGSKKAVLSVVPMPGMSCGRATVDLDTQTAVASSPGCDVSVTYDIDRDGTTEALSLGFTERGDRPEIRKLIGGQVIGRTVEVGKPDRVADAWKVVIDRSTGPNLARWSFESPWTVVFELTDQTKHRGARPYRLSGNRTAADLYAEDRDYCHGDLNLIVIPAGSADSGAPFGEHGFEPSMGWSGYTLSCSHTHHGVVAASFDEPRQVLDVRLEPSGREARYFRIEPGVSDTYTVVEVYFKHPAHYGTD